MSPKRTATVKPAAWANLGLLAARHQEYDTAYQNVDKARSLAPSNSQIEALLGVIESRRGADPTVSNTARLFSKGTDKIAQKVG